MDFFQMFLNTEFLNIINFLAQSAAIFFWQLRLFIYYDPGDRLPLSLGGDPGLFGVYLKAHPEEKRGCFMDHSTGIETAGKGQVIAVSGIGDFSGPAIRFENENAKSQNIVIFYQRIAGFPKKVVLRC